MTTAKELFESVTDVIRDAARIPQDRRLQPQNILGASFYGLEEVFGITASRG